MTRERVVAFDFQKLLPVLFDVDHIPFNTVKSVKFLLDGSIDAM